MKNTYKIAENTDKMLIHGRTVLHDGMIGIHWTASGIEIIFSGSSISFFFGALNSQQAVYLRITVDGKAEKHSLSTGRECIMIEDLQDTVHRLSLIRLNSDGADILYLDSMEIEGENAHLLSAPCELERKIEFYGDSITCGYGNLGYDGPGFLAHRSDGTKTYAYMTAQNLLCQGRYIGFSGQGIVHSWGGSEGVTFGMFYDRATHDLEDKWDFSAWKADVVVVNAGTNDQHGGTTPQEFYINGKKLLENLRKAYPDAAIIWLYGMMGAPFHDSVSSIINDLGADKNGFYYLQTAPHYADPAEAGGNGHPGLKCHKRVADELTAFIKRIMNW